MGGKFARYAVTTVAEELYNAYAFFSGSGQNTVTFVDLSGSTTFYKAGVGPISGAITAADCITGSYFIVTPTVALNAKKWQLRVKYDSGNTIKATLSMDGGWTSTSASAGGTFPTASCTPETTFNDAAAPAASSYLYCGTNTITYLSGSSYLTGTYAWLAVQDGATDADQMVYAGAYVPYDPVSDTNPVVFLSRKPDLSGANTNSFSYTTAGTSCNNRVAGEYAHTTSIVSAAYAYLSLGPTPQALSNCKTYTSIYPTLPLNIYTTGGNCLGYMHEQTILAVDTAKPNLDTNVAATYVVFADCFVYYNTAL